MKYKIDSDTCIGCGVCVAIYDELYEMGDDGKAFVKDLSEINEALADEALSQCPVEAIIKE